MDSRYRDRTIGLWQTLARRYRHETVVMGYDLLNEPLPNEWQHVYADELVALYKDLTRAIRVIDPDHLIMYEGSHWATNFSIFSEVWDQNSALQFHRYWMAPDEASIAPYLEARSRLGLPIYMGEGGENNLEWLYAAHRLYETHDIGWNFWPWKKIDTRTSPASVVPPPGWDEIVTYAHGGGRPDRRAAQATFDALLEAMRLDRCHWNEGVLRAILAHRPAEIPAWGFGYRGQGSSFQVTEGAPFPTLRANEAAGVGPVADDFVVNFHHTDGRPYADNERIGVTLNKGDWLEYEIDGLVRAEEVSVHGPKNRAASIKIQATNRGVRVEAVEDTVIGGLRVSD